MSLPSTKSRRLWISSEALGDSAGVGCILNFHGVSPTLVSPGKYLNISGLENIVRKFLVNLNDMLTNSSSPARGTQACIQRSVSCSSMDSSMSFQLDLGERAKHSAHTRTRTHTRARTHAHFSRAHLLTSLPALWCNGKVPSMGCPPSPTPRLS